jgi:ABC-type sugar transport system permease subunit
MKSKFALVLIAPAAILYIYSFVSPLALAAWRSLFANDAGTQVFVGLENYVRALKDPHFRQSFFNVGWLLLLIAPLGIGIPYTVAVLLQNFGKKMQSVSRFMVYVPHLTAGLIMALLWRWLLERDGLLNAMLGHVGIPGLAWMGEPWPARLSVAMVSLSSGYGPFVILYSAVILAIPRELKEAATIDGATAGQYRRMILRPILTPTLLLTLMLMIVGILQMWESIYVLFPTGGPKASVATPVYNIFLTTFMYSRSNLGAAKGLLALVVIASVVAIQRRIEAISGVER